MRQRKIKNLDEKLDALSLYIVEDAKEMKGKWRSFFSDAGIEDFDEKASEAGREAFDGEASAKSSEAFDGKLYAEFGCGKGKFIQGMAEAHPENGYIAFEGNQSVVYHALQKVDESGLRNVVFSPHYIDTAADYFEEGELDGIYLNFSDPWPKSKHEKRRLTYGSRLDDYIKAVKAGGTIEFRTDNDDLFEYTMDKLMMQAGIEIVAVTRDLHAEYDEIAGRIEITALTESGYDDDVLEDLTVKEDLQITSEYEDRFSERGKNINYVRVKVI